MCVLVPLRNGDRIDNDDDYDDDRDKSIFARLSKSWSHKHYDSFNLPQILDASQLVEYLEIILEQSGNSSWRAE